MRPGTRRSTCAARRPGRNRHRVSRRPQRRYRRGPRSRPASQGGAEPLPSLAPDRDEQHRAAGQRRHDEIERRRERRTREGQRRSRTDGHDHRGEGSPGRQPEDRRDHVRPTGRHDRPRPQGQTARGHRRRDDRHDEEVHERSDDRDAAEPGDGDRERGELGGERHAERLAQPTRQPAAAPRLETAGEGRRPGDEPSGRGGRQGEPRVGDEPRCGDEQADDRPAQRRGGAPAPARLTGEEDDAGHDRGPQHRRRCAGQDRVADDREEHRQRASTARPGPKEGCDRRGHDRDVPARDGHDVAHAGRREGRSQVAVDAIAQPDQDPGRESGLRLRQGVGQGLVAGPADGLDRRRPAHRLRPGSRGPSPAASRRLRCRPGSARSRRR